MPRRRVIEATLNRATAACAGRGTRLTSQRLQVLRLLLEAGQPVGAYTLLDRIRAVGMRAAPPVIYRALEFLVSEGLVHRVERLNAFVACSKGTASRDGHAHQFLICRLCGTTVELHDASVTRALSEAAVRAGFSMGQATVEAEGVCARCEPLRPPAPALTRRDASA